MKVLISKTALKYLNKLDKDTSDRIKGKLEILSENPLSPLLDVKKIKYSKKEKNKTVYRLRVGNYRIVYYLRKGIIKITDIFHRSDGYDHLFR